MVLRALHNRTPVAGKLNDDLTGIQRTAYQSGRNLLFSLVSYLV